MASCKTQFGTVWQRWWRGGVVLLPLEERLLETFVAHMPTRFQGPLRAQLDAYNLAQREVDGRALHLYRIKAGRVTRSDLPPLPCKSGETKLLRFQVVLPDRDSFHVAFWAVDRYLFGFNTDRDLRPCGNVEQFEIAHVRQSWRSAEAGAHDGCRGQGGAAPGAIAEEGPERTE